AQPDSPGSADDARRLLRRLGRRPTPDNACWPRLLFGLLADGGADRRRGWGRGFCVRRLGRGGRRTGLRRRAPGAEGLRARGQGREEKCEEKEKEPASPGHVRLATLPLLCRNDGRATPSRPPGSPAPPPSLRPSPPPPHRRLQGVETLRNPPR